MGLVLPDVKGRPNSCTEFEALYSHGIYPMVTANALAHTCQVFQRLIRANEVDIRASVSQLHPVTVAVEVLMAQGSTPVNTQI